MAGHDVRDAGPRRAARASPGEPQRGADGGERRAEQAEDGRAAGRRRIPRHLVREALAPTGAGRPRVVGDRQGRRRQAGPPGRMAVAREGGGALPVRRLPAPSPPGVPGRAEPGRRQAEVRPPAVEPARIVALGPHRCRTAALGGDGTDRRAVVAAVGRAAVDGSVRARAGRGSSRGGSTKRGVAPAATVSGSTACVRWTSLSPASRTAVSGISNSSKPTERPSTTSRPRDRSTSVTLPSGRPSAS